MANCLYPTECRNGPAPHARKQDCVTKRIEELRNVGPDAPTITAANGARQSAAAGAFTSVDPLVMFQIAQIQQAGDTKYGPDNWRRLPELDHINHALAHTYAHLAGDTQDDHLGHAVVRLMFALAVRLRPDYFGKDSDPSDDPHN